MSQKSRNTRFRYRAPTAAVAVALLLTASLAQAAADYTARVVAIEDGDTLTIQVNGRNATIRLADIIAPNIKQAYGKHARSSLESMCLNQDASIHETGKDRAGRTLARVKCVGTDAGREQVHRGMAWVAPQDVNDANLYRLQEVARNSRKGLWADTNPVPPWEWQPPKKKSGGR
jgi:endonuclease YncB( thermonuclease family)